jgi:hypothetical protein
VNEEKPQAATIDVSSVLTEPMTLQEAASIFRVNRRTIAGILAEIDGVQRVGRFHRIPIKSMPATYLLEHGLIRPAVVIIGHPCASDETA